MNAKMTKLDHQVHDFVTRKTNLFNGISIYVNGYTSTLMLFEEQHKEMPSVADPPSLVLQKLFVANGGKFHKYFQYGRTTYHVATHLAKTKMDSIRKGEKVISPRWIMDS